MVEKKRNARPGVRNKRIRCSAVASDKGPAARVPLGFLTVTGSQRCCNKYKLYFG